MASGFLGKEVPVYRLRVRVSCSPLWFESPLFLIKQRAFCVSQLTDRAFCLLGNLDRTSH